MSRRPLCLVTLLLMLGIAAANWLGISWIWRSPAGTAPEEMARRGETVYGEGIVCHQEIKTFRNMTFTYLYLKQTNLFIHSKKFPIRNLKCMYEGECEDFTGKLVGVTGRLTLPEAPTNPGQFDQRKYERARKIDYHMENIRLEGFLGEEGRGKNALRKLKKSCEDILEKIFPKSRAGVLEAMLLGEKGELESEMKGWYQSAGISHIIAISGLHMSLIGMALWKLLSRLGLSQGLSAGLAFGVLAVYSVFIGNPTTAVRALLMFGIMMGGKILGRSYDLLTALAFAGMLLLLDNPDLLFDCGFQMSFLAVVGIGVYGKHQMRMIKDVFDKRQQGRFHFVFGSFYSGFCKLRDGLWMGLFLWLFSLPVVLYSFYQVSVAGIFCNLLVVPIMPVVLASGGLALLAGAVHIGLGSIMGLPAWGILWLYEILGKYAEKLSWGVWTPGQPTVFRVLIYYAVLGVGFYMAKSCDKKSHMLLIQSMTAGILLCLMGSPWRSPVKITVLDVGQGDGILFQGNGAVFMVDGGSSSESRVGDYVILPYMKQQGISKITGIFLTHTDEDHVNGVREVLAEACKGWLYVECLFMPAWMEETRVGEEMVSLAEKAGVTCQTVERGDRITAGKMQFSVLYPGDEEFSQDPNGGSLVLEWESGGVRGILTGDLPSEQEENVGLAEENYDFLKVGHHGSDGSSSTEFLEKISPEIALISCGRNNRYGHPGQKTLERLEDVGADVFRTDELGAVSIRIDGKKYFLQEEEGNGILEGERSGYEKYSGRYQESGF